MVYSSERQTEAETHAMLGGCRQIDVVDSAYILYLEHLQNVVYAYAELHIRLVRVHDMGTRWELHQSVI